MHSINLLEAAEYLNSHKLKTYIYNFSRVFDGEIERKFLDSKFWQEKNKKTNFEERLKQQVRGFYSNFWWVQPIHKCNTTDEIRSLHNWRGAWAPFPSAQHLSAMNIFKCQIFREELFLKLKKCLSRLMKPRLQ